MVAGRPRNCLRPFIKVYKLLCITKNLLVYCCKCCNLIVCAARYLFVNRYRVTASNATRPNFSQKSNTYIFLVFWNNFEEITNTSLFLLKQLDYSWPDDCVARWLGILHAIAPHFGLKVDLKILIVYRSVKHLRM